MDNNQNISQRSIFSDEAWFQLSGYVNSQIMRTWSSKNPHQIIQKGLHLKKIGVWARVTARRLIGQIFFEGTLTAERSRTDILEPFIEQLHDDELTEFYFQQDGDCTQQTINYLQKFFVDKNFISRRTEVVWPARSCDLTPCDFFLWPYIKNNTFKSPVENWDDLRQRIQQKFIEINNNPVMLQNVFTSIRNRNIKCIEQGG